MKDNLDFSYDDKKDSSYKDAAINYLKAAWTSCGEIIIKINNVKRMIFIFYHINLNVKNTLNHSCFYKFATYVCNLCLQLMFATYV